MGILSAQDNTPPEELDQQIERAREEAKQPWTPDNRDGGETMLTCITVPLHEKNLERMLKKRGFKVITRFKRRTGYPQIGELKLWSLNLI